jgi:putative membrane protein insertion efficiency factor
MGTYEESPTGADLGTPDEASPPRGVGPGVPLSRRLATLPIVGYQKTISPLLGERCKYHPSCSRYAVGAIEQYGILRGVVLAGWRLLRCNPWSHGGIDRPEDQRVFRR